jgi:hypothetical protein
MLSLIKHILLDLWLNYGILLPKIGKIGLKVFVLKNVREYGK